MTTVLAIDLGTTWCKTAYVDPAGRVLAEGRAYSRFGSGYGAEETSLGQLWHALVVSVRQAVAAAESHGLPPPVALGLSCRGDHRVWLDQDGLAIGVPAGAPAQLRANETAEVYAAPVWGEAGPYAYAYFPIAVARTLWLRRASPAHWACVRRVVALHDWMIHQLTGVWATDPASGPGYLDVPAEAAALCGLPVAAFPPVRDFDVPLGPLTAEAARQLGLPPGVVVVCGCHDGVAANLGTGAMAPGDACITLGSSLVLRVVTAAGPADAFGYPLARDRWAWVRGVHGVAAQLDAIVAAIDGQGLPVEPRRHQACTIAARSVPAAARGSSLPILPRGAEARQGERAGQMLARGIAPGMIYRSALAGAADAIRGLADAARQDGLRPQRYIVTGAMTANTLLLEILSDALAALLAIADPESGVRGAAILAARGAGWYASLDESVARMAQTGTTIVTTRGVEPVMS